MNLTIQGIGGIIIVSHHLKRNLPGRISMNRTPTAELIRPTDFDGIVGQAHLFGENGTVRRMCAEGYLPNMNILRSSRPPEKRPRRVHCRGIGDAPEAERDLGFPLRYKGYNSRDIDAHRNRRDTSVPRRDPILQQETAAVAS